jgi:hypothetical protein
MIYIRLIGGLGNQMFQYALGRRLALINNTEFKLDISGLVNVSPNGGFTARNYDLNNFNIQELIAASDEIKHFKKPGGRFSKIIKYIRPVYQRPYIVEEKFSFNPQILKIKQDVYIDGYWQSEKYFMDVKEVIQNDFTLKGELGKQATDIAKQITSSSQSVSLHIRRGDYVTSYSSFYHILNVDYYKKALEYIEKRSGRVQVFVFSDDIKWARQNLQIGSDTVFVEPNKNFEDLHLMSLCSHNIMANSSFSWWGAWLNRNKNKIVIAPEKWFIKPIDTKDLIPASYIKL